MIEKYRDLAAAERTFLAWIRTSVSIVGFGIVAQHLSTPQNSALLTGASIALIAMGALLVIFAGIHFYIARQHILASSRKKAFGAGLQLMTVLMMLGLMGLLIAFIIRLVMPHW